MPPIKVFIIDDHDVIRQGLISMLESSPLIKVVGDHANARDAIAAAPAKQPEVILMDIKMPDMNGIEATRVFRESYPVGKIIILTIFEEKEFLQKALKAGASGYILKQVTTERLIDTICRVHAGEMVLDPFVFNAMLADYAEAGGGEQLEQKVNSRNPAAVLTPREQEILRLLADGYTNKEIAATLHIANDTVKTYLRLLYRKLGVRNRSQAVVILMGRLPLPRPQF